MSEDEETEPAIPSELSVMLNLYSEETDRNAIRKAYFGLAHGDPSTFAVQFCVLLTAHAQALKAYQRPDLDIQKARIDISRLTAAVDKLITRCLILGADWHALAMNAVGIDHRCGDFDGDNPRSLVPPRLLELL